MLFIVFSSAMSQSLSGKGMGAIKGLSGIFDLTKDTVAKAIQRVLRGQLVQANQ